MNQREYERTSRERRIIRFQMGTQTEQDIRAAEKRAYYRERSKEERKLLKQKNSEERQKDRNKKQLTLRESEIAKANEVALFQLSPSRPLKKSRRQDTSGHDKAQHDLQKQHSTSGE